MKKVHMIKEKKEKNKRVVSLKRGIKNLSRAAAVFTAAAVLLTGCSTFNEFKESLSQEDTDAVVRIGVFEPLSGSSKENGELEVQGIELAHELYPEVLGKKVELVYADNQSDLTGAEAAAKELVDKKVSVVLGSYGNTLSLAGGDLFAKARIPAIAITCTNPLITSSCEYYARVCFVDSFQGVAAAKYAFDDLGYRSAVVLKQAEDDYSTELGQMFSDKLASLTGDENAVTAVLEYKEGAKDFSKQLEAIRKSNSPLVYLPGGDKDCAEIIKQAGKMGISTFFLGTDAWETETFLKDMEETAKGIAFTSLFVTESNLSQRTEEFMQAYAKKYGSDTEPSGEAALGFDAYLLAIDAIDRAQTAQNGEAVMKCIYKTKEFQGATGSITIDSTGDPIKTVAIKAVENGAFVHKSTAEPVWGAPVPEQ